MIGEVGEFWLGFFEPMGMCFTAFRQGLGYVNRDRKEI